MWQWFKNLFVSFQVDWVGTPKDLEDASRRGFHAAIQGRFKLADGKTGALQWVAMGVTKRDNLLHPTPSDAYKIRRYLCCIEFVWEGPLICFDPVTGNALTTHVDLDNFGIETFLDNHG